MDARAQAVQEQISGGYAVDTWLSTTVQPMTKLWQGVGGHSNFFFSEHDARMARGSYVGSQPYRFAETLWQMAQVARNPTYGFRMGIAEFVVDLPAEAAIGICIANRSLGRGSVYQYFIPNWNSKIFATGRRFTFRDERR